MTQRKIVIAGTSSGVGKTTVTLGIMAALVKKGLKVQGFKCGPDYIDPAYHTAVTGRVSRTLDSWMLSKETVQDIFVHGSREADISIIEGMMGLYDGRSALSDEGSTAEISGITKTPVLLVVDCDKMARSTAAMVKGYQCFDPNVKIAGIIANNVGSEGHYRLIKEAVEAECGVPVIGFLPKDGQISMPERHLGLVPSTENDILDPLFEKLAELVERTIDLDLLLDVAVGEQLSITTTIFQSRVEDHLVRIAVAKDKAFHFYYPENLDLLQVYGAECVYFSPLTDAKLPGNIDGLYIGGGFPEEFAAELAQNQSMRKSVRQMIEKGLPTLAECGGFMYLADVIETSNHQDYPMVGVIPGKVRMQNRLTGFGYRTVKGCPDNFLLANNDQMRGHEFHYSTIEVYGEPHDAYEIESIFGSGLEGHLAYNVVAGYTHLHFASNPEVVKRWIAKCQEEKSVEKSNPINDSRHSV